MAGLGKEKGLNEKEIWGLCTISSFSEDCLVVCQEWKGKVQRTPVGERWLKGVSASLLDLFCSIISQHRGMDFSHRFSYIFLVLSVAKWARSWSINFALKTWRYLTVDNSILRHSLVPLSSSIPFNRPCWSKNSHYDTERERGRSAVTWLSRIPPGILKRETNALSEHTNGTLMISDGSRFGVDLR